MTSDNRKIYILKLDIDMDYKSERKVVTTGKTIGKRLAFASLFLPIIPVTVKALETVSGFHVTIEVSSDVELDNRDLVFLQLLLGSDWRREVFNYRRVLEKVFDNNWNVLFSIKRKGGRIVSWERRSALSEMLANTIVETCKRNLTMWGVYEDA